MAGPIIHLLVAREWAKERPDLIDCPEYYLGAIALDAIHIREGTGKEDKRRTHLYNHGSFDIKPLAEYARARKSAFDLGYMAHLLADPFWVAAYREIKGLIDENGRTRPDIYYPEMEYVEFALCDAGLMELLRTANAPINNPLLTADEIAAWRDRVVSMYEAGIPGGTEGKNITIAFVRAFVARAGAYLNDMMRRLDL